METKFKSRYLSVFVSVIVIVAIFWLAIRACSVGQNNDRSYYTIGRDSTWWPLDLRGKEKAMEGFTNDLIQEISKDQGVRIDVFEVGYNALFDGLDMHSYDGVFSALTPNVINKTKYAFSDPFYLIGKVLIVREDSKARSVEDLSGRIIGILSGSRQVYNDDEQSDLVFIPYPTAAKALENLNEKVIDGVILDALRAYVWTDGFYKGKLKVVTAPLTSKGLRMVTLNNAPMIRFISLFNQGLENAKKNGTYQRLIRKWQLINTQIFKGNSGETKS